MEQIKKSILEGSEAVKVEKHKNVELLNMIFPEAIAMKLWRGTEQYTCKAPAHIAILLNMKFSRISRGLPMYLILSSWCCTGNDIQQNMF